GSALLLANDAPCDNHGKGLPIRTTSCLPTPQICLTGSLSHHCRTCVILSRKRTAKAVGARLSSLLKSEVCYPTSSNRGDPMKIARSLGFVPARSVLPFFVLFYSMVHAAQPSSRPATAPPLRDCKITVISDLGLWDDVFVPSDQDFVV